MLTVVGGLARLDVRKWASRLSYLLLPSAVATFPRHRWVNSLQPLAQLVLLSVHNVLPGAGLLWLSSKLLGTAVPSFEGAASATRAALPWDLSDSEDEQAAVLPPSDATAVVAVAGSNPSTFWSVFNNDEKAKASRFFRSQPRDRLVIMRVSLAPAVQCSRFVEHVSSDK